MAIEETLRELWAATLEVEIEEIKHDSNFFQLGGNSLSVLTLQAAAFGEGLAIEYGQVFETPILHELATFVTEFDDDDVATPSDFEGDRREDGEEEEEEINLLAHDDTSSSPSQGFTDDAEGYGIASHTIEETFPCTPLQQGMIALSIQDRRMYRASYVYEIPVEADLDRLRDAWQAVTRAHQSLRSRIIMTAKSREAVQVVLKDDFHWTQVEEEEDRPIESYTSTWLEQQSFAYGEPLSTFHLITTRQKLGGARYLIWTVHHATYDGWALSLILQDVKTHYDSGVIPRRAQFGAFARHARRQNGKEKSRAFWQARLQGFEGIRWPSVRRAMAMTTEGGSGGGITTHREVLTMEYQKSRSETTFATLSKAGWGLLLSTHTGVPDVTFGTVVYGRNQPVAGVTEMVGPTMATVPVRIRTEGGDVQVASFLRDVQRQAVEATEFEHHGIQEISKLSGSTREACAFQTLLVVHSTFESTFTMNTGVGELREDLSVHDQYHPYALVIDVWEESSEAVRLDAKYDDKQLSSQHVRRLLEQYAHVMQHLAKLDPEARVDTVSTFSPQDELQVQHWNASRPTAVECCVHELFEKEVISHPEAPAVSAWDGELTYQELDALSSRLAAHLVSLGARPGSLVLICLDKSLWVIVAMLGVLKAGAAYVPLDPKVPLGRLEQVVEATGARLALGDAQSYHLLSAAAIPTVIRLSCEAANKWSPASYTSPVVVKPTDVAYIMFTSGSTGKPKGVILEHQAVSTSMRAHGRAMKFGPETRALHFVSLGFDVSVAETLTTLVHGGCICIPNEEQRLSSIADFIRSFRVNWAFFTPSVVSLIEPEQVPSLEVLVLGGEAIKRENIDKWADVLDLINGYGPTECAVFCVSQGIDRKQQLFSDIIGRAIGSTSWIVDDEGYLAAVGAVGELWIEGPQLARGYLNHDDATASAFITNPPFTRVQSENSMQGEQQSRRFYKTGDLVTYCDDGSMRYHGRKDTQVKIRGQRVELGEIEHTIQTCRADWSRVVVDAVKLDVDNDDNDDGNNTGSSRGQMLVAFVEVFEEMARNKEGTDTDDLLDEEDSPLGSSAASTAFAQTCQSLRLDLAAKLPGYMIPQVFIPVRKMPLTASSKVDRRTLREWALAAGPRSLVEYGRSQTEKREPSTHTERTLQGLWEMVLGLQEGSVGADDDLFQLGGDSIDAMRLVAAAAGLGLTLTVGQIFRRQRLCQLAEEIDAAAGEPATIEEDAEVQPFSLLMSSVRGEEQIAAIKAGVAEQCGVPAETVEDVYPCTPLQEGLMALAVGQSGAYVARHTFRLDANLDTERFKAAWSAVSKKCEILRTRIVHIDGRGSVQVVFSPDDKIPWEEEEAIGMREWVVGDKNKAPMGYGTVLSRVALVTDAADSTRYFVWTAHHSIYDGWSVRLIMERLNKVYQHGPVILEELTASTPPFSRFIKHILPATDSEKQTSDNDDYWRQYLAGWSGSGTQFPKTSAASQARTNASASHAFTLADPASTGVTHATMLRAAWALVLSRHTSSEDVVFGSVISGRNAPVKGISQVVGPTITTVPLRIQLESDATVTAFLNKIQQIGTDMIPYEQVGLQRIRSLSSDAREACQFQSILAVQPADKSDDNLYGQDSVLKAQQLSATDLVGFHTYSLVIECKLNKDNTTSEVEAQYDDNVLSSLQVDRLLRRFEHAVQQLADAAVTTKARVGDMNAFSPEDAAMVRSWNAIAPPIVVVERCIHEMFEEVAQTFPQSIAVSSRAGEFTYRQLSDASDRLAAHITRLGAGPGVMIPICFEKSRWVVVAILSVLKAGAAFVPLDEATPSQRLGTIVSSLNARLILCSPRTQPKIASIPYDGLQSVQVSPEALVSLEADEPATADATTAITHVTPSSPAYVIFTSGSTGVPKGVVIEHRSYCTSAVAHGRDAQMDHNTRALQFSSYAFDAALPEIISTMLFGGTVCIPSEEDRLDNLPGFISEFSVNWALLTPSVIRQYSPSELPSLKTILLGGEAMTEEELQWADGPTLINAYGPSECSVIATANVHVFKERGDARNIGRPVGCIGWVANEHDVNKPAMVGVAGELIVQGPTLARGYLNNDEATASAFVSRPAWMEHLQPEGCSLSDYSDKVYKTGDLVRYNEEDGSLIYVGRKDTQVKVRGQRVELSELEHHLCIHESVDMGVVVYPKSGPLAGKVTAVVAFTKQHGSEDETEQEDKEEEESKFSLGLLQGKQQQTAQVRQAMSDQLPSFMVPVAWLAVDSMPLNLSGKLDRARIVKWATNLDECVAQDALLLGEVDGNAVDGSAQRAVTPTECILQDMCADILGTQPGKLSMARSFLNHGGDSITAIQLVSRCRARGMRLSVQDILKSQTLSQLALRVSNLQSSKVSREEKFDQVFPLSPIQRHFFCLSSDEAYNAQFNQSFLVKLTRNKSVADVARAVEILVRQHSMLRARFSIDDGGKWQQRVTAVDAQGSFLFNSYEIQGEQPRAQIGSIISAGRTRMNIETGPMFAVDMFTVDDTSGMEEEKAGSQFLFLDAHHLVVDLVSWRILLSQLAELLDTGKLSSERAVPFQVWNRLQIEYAERELIPETTLPFELPPVDLDFWGIESGKNVWGDIETTQLKLDKKTTDLLLGDANYALQTEPVDLLIAGLLHSFRSVFPERAEQLPIVFNEGHGRQPWDADIDISGTVGWFTTLRPVTVCITDGESDPLLETTRQVKDTRLATPNNGWNYFTSRHLNTRGSDTFGPAEAVEVTFNYLGRFQQLENKDALLRQEPRVDEFDRCDMGPDAPRFGAVEVSASVEEGAAILRVAYNKNGHHIPRILEWAQAYRETLAAMAALFPGRPRELTVGDFPLLKLTQTGLGQLTEDRLPKLGITVTEIEDIYPCSPVQEGMLISQAKMSDHYRSRFTFEAISRDGSHVDISRLQRVWQAVVDRHGMLRTVFIQGVTSESAFAQVVLKRLQVDTAVPNYHQVTGGSPVSTGARPEHLFTFGHNSDGDVECQLDINHALIDGASLPIILKDLALAYQGSLPGSQGPLYHDYIAHISSSSRHDAALSYWGEALAELEPCYFPQLPGVTPERTQSAVLKTIQLDQIGQLTTEMQAFCSHHNVSISNVIQAAWAVLLRSYTGSEDVCFGYLTSGRDIPLASVAETVGPLINILTARLAVQSSTTMAELVTAAKDAHVQALPHQTCSLAEVQHKLGLPSSSALFNTAVSVQARLDEDKSEEAKLFFKGTAAHDPTEVS